MTDTNQPGASEPPTDIAAVRADIERTRAELSDTVDALSGKLDVKGRAGEKVAEARTKVADTATRAKQAAPPPVQHALDIAGDTAGPILQKAAPYRGKIVAGAATGLVLLIILRRRGRDS